MKKEPVSCSLFFAFVVAAAPAFAFHDGGVATCDGCHVSHGETAATGSQMELIADSPTDVCLICHSGSAGVMSDDPLVPGPERGAGNFVFLLEENLNDAPDGASNPIPGYAAGHNVVAPGNGLMADPRNPVAPGGTFPSNALGCTSCHDPHGKASYRLLYGSGPVQQGLASFGNDAPVAEPAPGVESGSKHAAYQSGMAAWCANCHGLYHEDGGSGFEHPVAVNLGTDASGRYNAYDGDANPGGGNPATAYLAEVPFEDPSASPTSTAGPTGTSKLMCLTCHRAHASSAPAAGRWDFNVSLLVDDGLASGSYPILSPYGSPDQGTLCSKCHASGAGPALRAPERYRGTLPIRREPRHVPR